MSEDTIFWQTFYGRASERHAYLYLRKATQGYNFQKKDFVNLDVILPEIENLRMGAVYFSSHGKPELALHLNKVILAFYAQESNELAEEALRLTEKSRQARKRIEEIYGTGERKSMTSRVLSLLPQAVKDLVSRPPTSPIRRTNLPRPGTYLDSLVEEIERELYHRDSPAEYDNE